MTGGCDSRRKAFAASNPEIRRFKTLRRHFQLSEANGIANNLDTSNLPVRDGEPERSCKLPARSPDESRSAVNQGWFHRLNTA